MLPMALKANTDFCLVLLTGLLVVGALDFNVGATTDVTVTLTERPAAWNADCTALVNISGVFLASAD
jgi:hypothetical protein